MTGLLDLASPLLSDLDRAMAPLLPPAARIALWALVAASVSMALYAVISPQQRLRRAKASGEEAKQALDSHDGSLAEAAPLIGRMLSAAFLQLGLVFGPAFVAATPVLFMIVWMSGAFGHFVPASTAQVPLRVVPTELQVHWQPLEPDSETTSASDRVQIRVTDRAGRLVEALELDEPVTILHKRRWWNFLIANPLGYLPAEGILESVEVGWPRQQILTVGPQWLRGWEAIFFGLLLAASLAIKLVFRLI